MSENRGKGWMERLMGSGRRTRLWAPLSVVAVLAILLLGAGSAGATSSGNSQSPSYTVLITLPLLDAIAANQSTVFAQAVTNCSQIWAINTWDNASLYATVPNGNRTCSEGALTIAPYTICPTTTPGNLSVLPRDGEWGNRGGSGGGQGSSCQTPTSKSPCHNNQNNIETLYDVLDGVLYEITNGGANVTTIATFNVSTKASENMGLTYDQVGSFDHDLIVTSSSGGQVWLVNQTGVVTLLTALNTYIGGPAVAPEGFGTYGGDVVIAAKTLGEVVAVTPSGNETTVANWSKANAVTFPSDTGSAGGSGRGYGGCGGSNGGCTFGRQHFALFVANYSSGALEAFPASEISHANGQGFVAGGLNQGIGEFKSNGNTKFFASNTERLSDIASVSCFPETQGCGGGGCGGHGGW